MIRKVLQRPFILVSNEYSKYCHHQMKIGAGTIPAKRGMRKPHKELPDQDTWLSSNGKRRLFKIIWVALPGKK